jgi:hypothetical protein
VGGIGIAHGPSSAASTRSVKRPPTAGVKSTPHARTPLRPPPPP